MSFGTPSWQFLNIHPIAIPTRYVIIDFKQLLFLVERQWGNMIRLALITTIGIALAGCGREPVLDVDPAFMGYLARFEAVSVGVGRPVQVQELVMKFGPLSNPHERAICTVVEDEPPTVIVNQNTWGSLDDGERESLVFHELGHCILRRKHITQVDQSTGVPVSLMNPYALDSGTYENHKTHYHSELFEVKETF